MSITDRLRLVVTVCVAVLAWGNRSALLGAMPVENSPAEVARVRHHLEGAEAILISRGAATLTVAQRAARERCIAELRAYTRRGVFPHNHQLPGRRTPVFVDEHGTRCAMAYLIERSGDEAMVARISRTRNLARIRDLADDAELVAWLDRNGLTLAEAARIQPQYDGRVDGEESTSASVWTASLAGAATGSTGLGLNLSIADRQGARNTRGMLGVVLGLLGCGLGATGLSHDGGVRVLGAVDVGVGLASFGLGIRQLDATQPPPRASAHAIGPAIWRDGSGVRRFALVTRF